MKETRAKKVFVTIVLIAGLMSGVAAYVARSPQTEASQEQMKPLTEKDKATKIRNHLEALLSEVGVQVADALPDSKAPTYRDLRVRYESFGKTGANGLIEGAQPAVGTLAQLSSIERAGTLPRERSVELSTDRILIIGVDQNRVMRWWKLMVDPRLVRAEAPGPNGEMQGKGHYVSSVDFSIEYPEDPQLKELRLYRVTWDGREFHLELLGALPAR